LPTLSTANERAEAQLPQAAQMGLSILRQSENAKSKETEQSWTLK
jgi:hypothetical protein